MLSQGLQMGLLIGSALLLLAAVPLATVLRWLRTAGGRLGGLGIAAVAVLALAADARPWTIVGHHFAEDIGIISGAPLERAVRLANANLYRHLDAEVAPGYLILNAYGGDELQAQFYSTHPVYGWWPAETDLNRLLAQGWHVAYFRPTTIRGRLITSLTRPGLSRSGAARNSGR